MDSVSETPRRALEGTQEWPEQVPSAQCPLCQGRCISHIERDFREGNICRRVEVYLCGGHHQWQTETKWAVQV